MLNQVTLIGRLTRDPELRYTANGVAVANFGLAVERPFTNKEGEKEVDFINITTWRKQAETVSNHLGKGRLVAVQGRLQIDNYEDKEGNKRKSANVVSDNVRFLDWPKDEEAKEDKEDVPF